MPHYLSLIHELFAFLSFSLNFILQFLAHSLFLSSPPLSFSCHLFFNSSVYRSFFVPQFYLSLIHELYLSLILRPSILLVTYSLGHSPSLSFACHSSFSVSFIQFLLLGDILACIFISLSLSFSLS
jgi:hypothetical protein